MESQIIFLFMQGKKALNAWLPTKVGLFFLYSPLYKKDEFIAYYLHKCIGNVLVKLHSQTRSPLASNFRALNFGSLGMLVGHEIAHAISKKGKDKIPQ